VLAVGDIVNLNGMLGSSGGLTLSAKVIRDLSKEKVMIEKHTFEGKLQAAIGTTSLPTSFGLVSGNTTYTVNVPVGTPILAKNWASTNLGTFQANDTVRVYGSLNGSSTSMIDAVVVRDATR
jgi:hypothetical protein